MYAYGRFDPFSLTDLFSILTDNIIGPSTVTRMEHDKGSLALTFQWNLAYCRVNPAAEKREKKREARTLLLSVTPLSWHVPLLKVTAPLKVASSADFLLPGTSNCSLPLTLG